MSSQEKLPEVQRTKVALAVQTQAIQGTDFSKASAPVARNIDYQASTRYKMALIGPTESPFEPSPEIGATLAESSIKLSEVPYKDADISCGVKSATKPVSGDKTLMINGTGKNTATVTAPTQEAVAFTIQKIKKDEVIMMPTKNKFTIGTNTCSLGDESSVEIQANMAQASFMTSNGEDKCPMMNIPEDKTTIATQITMGNSHDVLRVSEDRPLMLKKMSEDKVPVMQTPRCKISITKPGREDTIFIRQALRNKALVMAPTDEDKACQDFHGNDSTDNCVVKPRVTSQCNTTTCQLKPSNIQDSRTAAACCKQWVGVSSPQEPNSIAAVSCGLGSGSCPSPPFDLTKDQVSEATFDGASESEKKVPLAGPPVTQPVQQKSAAQPSSYITEVDESTSATVPEIKQTPPTEKLEVVVAHYDEDLNWLHPFLKHPDVKVSIYSKGGRNLAPELHTHTIYLDNIGREGHTYLYHIVTRYESLSKVVLFCQGDPLKYFHVDYTPTEFLTDALKTPRLSFVTFKGQKMVKFDEWDGIKMEDYILLPKRDKIAIKPAARTPAEYWSLLMEPLGYKVPESVGFAPGANFSVQNSMIYFFPRAFWTQFFSEFFLGPMEDINPMTGYICERFWPAIFIPTAFSMYPGDIPHTVKHDMRFGRLTRGNWKTLPKNLKEFIPGATPHDLAITLGIDVLDIEIARDMHKKAQITMSSGESSDSSL